MPHAVIMVEVVAHCFCFLPCHKCLVFVIPYVGLVISCAVPDDVQKESVGYVLGGIEQPHVRWGVSGKGGKGGNVFEIVGY